MADAVNTPLEEEVNPGAPEKPRRRARKKAAPEAETLTELLPEEEAAAEGEGKKKKKKPKREKKAKAKKRRGGLFLLVALVVLIIAAGVFLYLTVVNDWGGVRTSFLTLVNQLDPQFRHLEEQRIVEYNAAVDQLELDQAQLKADQEALDKRLSEVGRREVAVSQAESDLEPIYRRNLSEAKLDEIKKTAKMYENMDAQVAAGIMSRLYDESYMAALLYYMSAGSAADVMTNMSAELAARITTELLKN